MGWEEMREALRKAGQDHVLKPPPPAKRRDAFLSQLCSIDLEGLPRMLETSLAGAEEREVKREPFPDVVSLAELPSDKVSSLRARGLTMIAKREVAALLLAGGQGTRLGTSAPKGCYDIGLPSGKSLFQYHAEKILKVRRLAAAHAKVDESTVRLRLLVMTSDATDEETKAFFAKHEYALGCAGPPPSIAATTAHPHLPFVWQLFWPRCFVSLLLLTGHAPMPHARGQAPARLSRQSGDGARRQRRRVHCAPRLWPPRVALKRRCLLRLPIWGRQCSLPRGRSDLPWLLSEPKRRLRGEDGAQTRRLAPRFAYTP